MIRALLGNMASKREDEPRNNVCQTQEEEPRSQYQKADPINNLKEMNSIEEESPMASNKCQENCKASSDLRSPQNSMDSNKDVATISSLSLSNSTDSLTKTSLSNNNNDRSSSSLKTSVPSIKINDDNNKEVCEKCSSSNVDLRVMEEICNISSEWNLNLFKYSKDKNVMSIEHPKPISISQNEILQYMEEKINSTMFKGMCQAMSNELDIQYEKFILSEFSNENGISQYGSPIKVALEWDSSLEKNRFEEKSAGAKESPKQKFGRAAKQKQKLKPSKKAMNRRKMTKQMKVDELISKELHEGENFSSRNSRMRRNDTSHQSLSGSGDNNDVDIAYYNSLVQCPICSIYFPDDDIELHAEHCCEYKVGSNELNCQEPCSSRNDST